MHLGFAPARLLVERLVVPEADRFRADQLGGRAGDARMEGERRDLRVILPEVLTHGEAALERRLLVETARIVAGTPGDGAVDVDAETSHVGRVEQSLGAHEPVALEGSDDGGIQDWHRQ